MAITKNNQNTYISDVDGNIKTMNWKSIGSSEDYFELNDDCIKVGSRFCTFSICLTNDENNLLVGCKEILKVFNLVLGEVIKEFTLSSCVIGVGLIRKGKKAIVVEQDGGVTIIDLNDEEVSSRNKQSLAVEGISRMSVI